MSEQAAVKLAENLGREKKLRAWSWEEREGGVVVRAKETSAGEEHRLAHSSLQSIDSPILDKLFHGVRGKQGKRDNSFDEASGTTIPKP